jgi:hypothetical protein
MLSVITSVAPVLSLIMVGYLARKFLIPDMNFWDKSNMLLYWILMPTLLFYHTSTIDTSSGNIGKYASVILMCLGIATVISLITTKLLGYDAKVTSSVLQGSTRHNSFIVLALAGKLFSDEGIAMTTLGLAIFIPATNIVVVGIVAGLLQKKDKAGGLAKAVLDLTFSILKNPILISIFAGILFSSIYGSEIIVLHDTLNLLGNSALPLVLLVIGANLRIMRLSGEAIPIAISVIIKMIILPILLFIFAKYLDLTNLETSIVVLFGVVPTAASSFSVARQLGGDYELMGSIITVQTLFSFISVPIIVGLLQVY